MLLQSIDVRPVFRIHNQYARWIDQHGEAAIPLPSLPITTQYMTAYYEKGITGRNIIVGVADTGIDVDMPVRVHLKLCIFLHLFIFLIIIFLRLHATVFLRSKRSPQRQLRNV